MDCDRFEAPYAVLNRKERSRELAQKRRTTYKSLMKDLAEELPFSKDVVSQIDYNSRLRLALCYFRMKNILGKGNKADPLQEKLASLENDFVSSPQSVLKSNAIQELVTESLDGFVLVTLADGSIVYLTESIHKHLGLFQSEHIGFSLYDLVHDDDHASVKRAIQEAQFEAVTQLRSRGSVECSFFCRMKCSRFKVANTGGKSPSYKVVFVSGHFKLTGNEPFLVAMVRPVSPPSVLEIRMEGNMYVTHYSLDFRCCFYDGRLRHLLGWDKKDLIGHVPFEFHHHDDIHVTLECAQGMMSRGEGLSGYYRTQNRFGDYIWVQSRATIMNDSRTGNPSYIVCMNYIINKEAGEKELIERKSIKPPSKADSERAHEPFPVPRGDGNQANPFASFMKMMMGGGGGGGGKGMEGMMAGMMASMGGMPGMAGMMEMLMGGAQQPQQSQMPSMNHSTPSSAEEPSSTFTPPVGSCRSNSASPQSDPSVPTSVSPRTITPDTTTPLDPFPDSQYYNIGSYPTDGGYCSGSAKSSSVSTNSPASLMMTDTGDGHYSPDFSTSPLAHDDIKQEVIDSPNYKSSCCYSSKYNTNHVKQEPYPLNYSNHSHTFATGSVIPVSTDYPASLPVLSNDDLKVLDLTQNTVPISTYPLVHNL